MQSRYLTSSAWGSWTIFIRTGGQVSLRVVQVMWVNLEPLAFTNHILSHFWIARSPVCSLWEAMAGSQSVAKTAVSSAKVAVVVSGEVARSAVYRRYRRRPRTLPWGTPVHYLGSIISTGPRPLEQCRVRSVEVCASTSVAASASRTVELQTWCRKHTPHPSYSPYFYPSMSCIVHIQHRNKRAGLCGGWKGLPPWQFSAELLPARATETTR
jgi:hypothetical protein